MNDEPTIDAQLAHIEDQSQAFDAHRRKIGRAIEAALILLTIFVVICLVVTMLF
jgi:hypothetical protein